MRGERESWPPLATVAGYKEEIILLQKDYIEMILKKEQIKTKAMTNSVRMKLKYEQTKVKIKEIQMTQMVQ